MSASDHPKELLLAMLGDRLESEEQRREVQEHLDTCEQCTRFMEDMRGIVAADPLGSSARAPKDLIPEIFDAAQPGPFAKLYGGSRVFRWAHAAVFLLLLATPAYLRFVTIPLQRADAARLAANPANPTRLGAKNLGEAREAEVRIASGSRNVDLSVSVNIEPGETGWYEWEIRSSAGTVWWIQTSADQLRGAWNRDKSELAFSVPAVSIPSGRYAFYLWKEDGPLDNLPADYPKRGTPVRFRTVSGSGAPSTTP